MTRKEAMRQALQQDVLHKLGITREHAEDLRRISMTLHSWFERECGTSNGCIERDEATGKPCWLNSHSMRRYPIRDMEKGANKRLAAIMAKYPTLSSYIQGDPRGAALYILRPNDVPTGQNANAYYNRGICIY